MSGKPFAAVVVGMVAACAPSGIEGDYSADDGEGTRVSVTLQSGKVIFSQGYGETAAIEGSYSIEGERVLMNLGGRELVLAVDGDCLYPIEEPTQTVCR